MVSVEVVAVSVPVLADVLEDLADLAFDVALDDAEREVAGVDLAVPVEPDAVVLLSAVALVPPTAPRPIAPAITAVAAVAAAAVLRLTRCTKCVPRLRVPRR